MQRLRSPALTSTIEGVTSGRNTGDKFLESTASRKASTRSQETNALEMDFFNWERQLLRLWEDLVEPGSHPQFFIVNPDPVRTSLQSFHAHVIIVQNRRLEAPILTTMLWHGQHQDFLFQRALFVLTELHLEVLQHKLDVVNHCQATHCTWWKGPQRILDEFFPRVLPGEGIQLVLHDPVQPDREEARFPTVEWPYAEPPPPHVDPEDLFLHEDDQHDDELLLTQLQTSLLPEKPGEQSAPEQHADLLFDDKENCDPALVRKDALTYPPTSIQKRHFEDGTRPPLRTALSSLTFATTHSSKQTAVGDFPIAANHIHSFADSGNDEIPVEQTRLLPEIDLPPIRDPSPEEQPAPQRPAAIWTYPTWIQELWTTLRRYGTVEKEEEGPTIQVVTWHIHQETHRRCYRPRVLRLNDICDTWEQQIRRLWADQIDPHRTIDYFKVFPTPPRLSEQPIAHLLLSQGPGDEKAILITALWESQIPNLYGITYVATYLPESITPQVVIDASDAAAQCTNRASMGLPCQVYVANMPIISHDPVLCDDGYGLRVYVPWRDPGPPPDLDDEVTLLTTAQLIRQELYSNLMTSTTSPTSRDDVRSRDVTRPSVRTALSSPFPYTPNNVFHGAFDSDGRIIDHDDIDDEISHMAINVARQNYDQDLEPLLEQPGIARNIDSPDLDIPQDDLQDLLDEEAEMEQPQSSSDQEAPAPPPRQEPIKYSSIIYMINSPPIQAQMAYGDRNAFYAQAAALIQIPLNHLVYLYKVPYPPEDLDQSRTIPMIAQLTEELVPGSIHRYVLLDIEFHAPLPTLTPETDRSARLWATHSFSDPSNLRLSQLLRASQDCASGLPCLDQWQTHSRAGSVFARPLTWRLRETCSTSRFANGTGIFNT